MWARSEDGGDSYIDFGVAAALTTPTTAHWTGIVGSVARLDDAHIMFASASDPHVRKDMRVRASVDGGNTWLGSGRVVWDGPAGYVDVAGDGNNGYLLFENGNETFADRITFASFDKACLLR